MSRSDQQVETSSLPATGGSERSLQDFRGAPLVVYFYPRDNTPGCTKEGQAFRDLYDEFRKAGAEIVGVSRDSLKTHENFKSKQDFPFELISDADEELCTQFDVIKEKNMYGKKVMGIERSTFLLDADGRIAREWRKVKVPGHAEEVLEAVRELD
ncbi:MAG: peroxiredoxin [Candidatus Wenzhouxiangella sp. M2_3B_020]